MNEFDQFIKHELKVKYYARYTDDFIVIADTTMYLKNVVASTKEFLAQRLQLTMHPSKVMIHSCYQGIDFLGYIVFPHHRVVRTRTKKRMLRNLERKVKQYDAGTVSRQALFQSLQSYLGVLSHANSYKLRRQLRNRFWL